MDTGLKQTYLQTHILKSTYSTIKKTLNKCVCCRAQLKQLCVDSKPAAGVRNATKQMIERKREGVDVDRVREGEAPQNKTGSRKGLKEETRQGYSSGGRVL